MKMKKSDIYIIAAVLVIAAAVFGIVYMNRTKEEPDYVVVYFGSKEVARYPLNEDLTTTIEPAEGEENTLVIEDGVARITHANCTDQICVYQSAISQNGDMIVCLPHQLLIMVESSEEADTDSVAN